jgi:hypothetical protein
VWIKDFGDEKLFAGRRVSLPDPFWGPVETGEEGCIDVGLIPGVTYGLSAFGREVHTFVAEPGVKQVKGDIVLPAR